MFLSMFANPQDIGWFDEHPAGELPGVVTAAMGDIQDGIGRKVPLESMTSVDHLWSLRCIACRLPGHAIVISRKRRSVPV